MIHQQKITGDEKLYRKKFAQLKAANYKTRFKYLIYDMVKKVYIADDGDIDVAGTMFDQKQNKYVCLINRIKPKEHILEI